MRGKSKSSTASLSLVRRAAAALAHGWLTSEDLGRELYGACPTERIPRMSLMVRARRPVNVLRRMGLLAVRPGARGAMEYTLLPGAMEELGC